MRVVRAHLRQRHVSISVARDVIVRAAELLKMGAAGPETEDLAVRLEAATGCTVSQLAKDAADWPASHG
jgi:hypothetical protein